MITLMCAVMRMRTLRLVRIGERQSQHFFLNVKLIAQLPSTIYSDELGGKNHCK